MQCRMKTPYKLGSTKGVIQSLKQYECLQASVLLYSNQTHHAVFLAVLEKIFAIAFSLDALSLSHLPYSPDISSLASKQ